MDNKQIGGNQCLIVTPLNDDETVDEQSSRKLIDFLIERGESIWTESSYKYTPAGIVALLERAGFGLVEQWIEEADGFALTLVEAR